MNAPKCNEIDYINFLIATPKVYSCTEAARVQPEQAALPAHDSFTRLLQRLEPSSEDLWQESQQQVERTSGILVLDDSTLDKPYAQRDRVKCCGNKFRASLTPAHSFLGSQPGRRQFHRS